MNQKKIGSFLKELRKEMGITQEEFAEKLDVSSRTISRWETGANMPDISLLVNIAEIFNVSIPEIINGERKSEIMEKEAKKVAEAMSDYATAEKAEDGRWKVSFTAKETENKILLVYTQKNGIFENSGATISYKASAASEADKQEQETVTAEIISTGEIHSGDKVTVKITAPSYVEFVKLSDGTDELEISSTRKVKLGKAVFEVKFTADKSQTLNILTASSEEIYEESGISFEIEVK
mgnify:CR=1 FL=1